MTQAPPPGDGEGGRLDYGKPGDPSGCYFPAEWRGKKPRQNTGNHPDPLAPVMPLVQALQLARWYVADHQDAQPNEETAGHLFLIDAALAEFGA